MIGGMVGNNSCGSNSVVYRSTREHLLEVKAILSDGSDAEFKALDLEAFHKKCDGETLEASIYRKIRSLLSNYDNQIEIKKSSQKALSAEIRVTQLTFWSIRHHLTPVDLILISVN